MNEYELHLFMVWHESTNLATTTAMEQRGRRQVHKTNGEAEGPTKWQDQKYFSSTQSFRVLYMYIELKVFQ